MGWLCQFTYLHMRKWEMAAGGEGVPRICDLEHLKTRKRAPPFYGFQARSGSPLGAGGAGRQIDIAIDASKLFCGVRRKVRGFSSNPVVP